MSGQRPNCCPIAFPLNSSIHCPIWSVFIHRLTKLITAVEGHYLKVLRRFFRCRSFEGLTQAVTAQTLTLTGPCQTLAHPQAWQHFMQRLHEHEWVVYAKRPMREPAHVLKYLARYTHRVAITNRRLLALEAARAVRFAGGITPEGIASGIMTLDAVECIRRFLLHLLPRGAPTHPALWLSGSSCAGGAAHAAPPSRGSLSAAASPVGIPSISDAGATTACSPEPRCVPSARQGGCWWSRPFFLTGRYGIWACPCWIRPRGS